MGSLHREENMARCRCAFRNTVSQQRQLNTSVFTVFDYIVPSLEITPPMSTEALMPREVFYSQARHLLHPRPWALYCRGCLPLKERLYSEVVTRGVKVLLKRPLTAK
jgi:hypothetical protein